jgi:hypothetical protein
VLALGAPLLSLPLRAAVALAALAPFSMSYKEGVFWEGRRL